MAWQHVKCALFAAPLLTSFGCGADPSYHRGKGSKGIVSQQRASNALSPEAPRETVAELQACVDHFAPGLSPDSYAVLFDIEATKAGRVSVVKVRDSMIAGSAIEACLTGALARMAVPVTVINARRDASPHARSVVGVVQAVAAPIAMMPIALVAAGVTILVGVTIHVVAKAVDEQKRCSEVKERCIDYCSAPAGFARTRRREVQGMHATMHGIRRLFVLGVR